MLDVSQHQFLYGRFHFSHGAHPVLVIVESKTGWILWLSEGHIECTLATHEELNKYLVVWASEESPVLRTAAQRFMALHLKGRNITAKGKFLLQRIILLTKKEGRSLPSKTLKAQG